MKARVTNLKSAPRKGVWVRLPSSAPKTASAARNSPLIVHPHRRPPRDLVGTVLVLVAADIEAAIVLARGAVFADVGFSSDLHDRAQLDALRARNRVVTAADIGPRRCNAGGAVGL